MTICNPDAYIEPNLKLAVEQWANESKCTCIDLESDSQFIKLWALVIFGALVFCFLITLPFCPRWRDRRFCLCRKKAAEGKEPETRVQELQAGDLQETVPDAPREAWDADATDEDCTANPKPDLRRALAHLVKTSVTRGGKWRPVWKTRLEELAEIGGPGTQLYFALLRDLGVVFAYMAALTCASIVFNAVSNFAPDNGNALARTTIGNIGSSSNSGTLAPHQRYIILKDESGACEGIPVTATTGVLGWLDFLAAIAFLIAVVHFRFFAVPHTAQEADKLCVTPMDYAVEIDHLPRHFEGMEVVQHDVTKYEDELTEMLERIATKMREKQQLPWSGAVEPVSGEVAKVKEMVLVRDFKKKLSRIKDVATWKKEEDICRTVGESKKADALLKKVDAARAKLTKDGAELKEAELDIVRAYVIMSTPKDAQNLRGFFRFTEYSLLRWLSEVLGNCGFFECCCPQRQRMFYGKAIRVKQAPEPSNIIWENQDVPYWERKTRQGVVGIIFTLIVLTSFALVYAANVGAKMNTKSSAQLLGNEECDPDLGSLPSEDGVAPYACLVANATNWTMSFVEGATPDEKACFCGAIGYSNIAQNPDLVKGVCREWLLAVGSGVGIGVLATSIVVTINIFCKTVLLMLAEQEKHLSVSAQNAAKMVKIFALQTLNTGFVIFCVNFKPPPGTPFGFIFLGEFKDSVRGWYVVVGAAILSNMLANAVTPAATDIGTMLFMKLRRYCCAGRQKHQARLIELYTNPEFDMAARFAQLLNTIFVTMAYSAGMPALNVFACLYMAFTFWADKLILLRGSNRPPSFDVQMAQTASQIMLYAVPLHCVFAIWMFGQPCTFPSNPLGGSMAELAQQGTSASGLATQASDGLMERLTKESTWMISLLLLGLIILYVLWTVLWVLGGTLGEFLNLVMLLICPSRKKDKKDDDDNMLWKEAKPLIMQKCPPASYKREEHPAWKNAGDLAQTLRGGGTRKWVEKTADFNDKEAGSVVPVAP